MHKKKKNQQNSKNHSGAFKNHTLWHIFETYLTIYTPKFKINAAKTTNIQEV